MSDDRILSLAKKFHDGTATEAEKAELHAWYDSFGDDEEQVVVTREPETFDSKKDKLLQCILANLEKDEQVAAPVVPLFRRSSFIKAASVVFLLGLATIVFMLTRQETDGPAIATIDKTAQPQGATQQKIMLKLADGREIALDSAGEGLVSVQGGTDVVKGADGLTYNSGSSQLAEVMYNTITIPKGQQFKLSLPDGSKVWLNSASSLTFPVAFTGKERKVTMTGEGYFEIAKNAAQPFKVDVNGKCEVEVLGTHFNINAYDNAALLKTTLLEGKLRVSPVANRLKDVTRAQVLLPGQQAQLSKDGNISIEPKADTVAVMAWKNGQFRFEDATIEEIMQQAQQWYDIDKITYKGNIDDRFYSTIPRNASLSQFLEILEKTGNVHFTLTDKSIEIHP